MSEQPAKQVEGGDCANCVHRSGWECRRYPPAVTRQEGTFDDGRPRPAEWSFAPAGTSCGEFKFDFQKFIDA